MKCPQCGLVTFDDLPECPRCKESFALVRPLASSSLDGARHVLRDDPELRLELRNRLHRARLDRRKQNENPLATGSDPDAPDWFDPDLAGDNGADEADMAPTREADERRKEGDTVHIDDPSADDDVRGGATTTDADEPDIIEASREPDDDGPPDFNGDIPGFSDWREELRERLKRIRARREQERIAAEDDEETLVAETDADDELAAEAGADADDALAGEAEADADDEHDLVAEPEAAPDETIDVAPDEEADESVDIILDEEADEETEIVLDEEPDEPIDIVLDEQPDEPSEEVAAAAVDAPPPVAPPTAGDVIAQIIDGRGADAPAADDEVEVDVEVDVEPASAAESEFDFTIADDIPVIDLDLDEADAEEAAGPDALVLGEKQAQPSVSDDDEDEALPEEHIAPVAPATPASPPAAETERDAATEAPLEEIDAEELAEGPAEELAQEPAEEIAQEPAEEIVVAPAIEEPSEEPPLEEPLEPLDEDVSEPAAPDDTLDWETDAEPAAEHEEISADEAREELDEIFAAPTVPAMQEADEPGPDDEAVEPAADLTVDDDLAAEPAEPEQHDAGLPPVVMPTLDDAGGGAPELDFEPTPGAHAPEIDLPPEVEDEKHALEWDEEATPAAMPSSAAPLGERAAATLCDTLVLTAIGAALVGAASSGAGVPFLTILVEEAVWIGLAWAIFAVGYSVFFVGACGQTIGRMVMRLRVIGDNQFSVGFDRAAIRLAAWLLSALPLLAGMLPALRDPKRRALHDRLSHTRVVKA